MQILNGNVSSVTPVLLGGTRPEHRLAIHQRHYVTSLTRAWSNGPCDRVFVGSELVTPRDFVRSRHPVETMYRRYGDRFLALGAACRCDSSVLAQFAELEWHLGRLALATRLRERAANHLDWALDELIGLYLTDTAPDEYALQQEDVWLEMRGLRGELQMNRLTGEEFARRMAAQPKGAHP